jgi:hypothetical protein
MAHAAPLTICARYATYPIHTAWLIDCLNVFVFSHVFSLIKCNSSSTSSSAKWGTFFFNLNILNIFFKCVSGNA